MTPSVQPEAWSTSATAPMVPEEPYAMSQQFLGYSPMASSSTAFAATSAHSKAMGVNWPSAKYFMDHLTLPTRYDSMV